MNPVTVVCLIILVSCAINDPMLFLSVFAYVGVVFVLGSALGYIYMRFLHEDPKYYDPVIVTA